MLNSITPSLNKPLQSSVTNHVTFSTKPFPVFQFPVINSLVCQIIGRDFKAHFTECRFGEVSSNPNMKCLIPNFISSPHRILFSHFSLTDLFITSFNIHFPPDNSARTKPRTSLLDKSGVFLVWDKLKFFVTDYAYSYHTPIITYTSTHISLGAE